MELGIQLGLREGPIKSESNVPAPQVPSVPHHARWLILEHCVCFLYPTLIWAANLFPHIGGAVSQQARSLQVVASLDFFSLLTDISSASRLLNILPYIHTYELTGKAISYLWLTYANTYTEHYTITSQGNLPNNNSLNVQWLRKKCLKEVDLESTLGKSS